MNVVGKVGSLISQGVTTVAAPFHPFGGAVDIIVVLREDGTYRTTPWCVRFGKFQGVLKVSEKIVTISVNGVDANFHMYLDNSGEAYFLKEVDTGEDGCQQDEDLVQNVEKGSSETGIIDVADDACEENSQMVVPGGVSELQRARQEVHNDESALPVGGFIDEQALDENKEESLSTSSSFRYDSTIDVQLDDDGSRMSHSSESEVVLMTVDGHLISAPVSNSESMDNVQLSTPRFYLVPEEDSGIEVNEVEESTENMDDLQISTPQFYLVSEEDSGVEINEVEGSTGYQGVCIENCAEKSAERPTIEQCEQSPCSVQEFTASSSDSLLEGVIVNNDTGSSSTAEICVPIDEFAGHVEIKCNGGDHAEFCAENIQAGPDESVVELAVDSSKDQEELFSSCLVTAELAKHIENGDSGNLAVALETTHCSFVDEKINHVHKDLDKYEAAEIRPENGSPTSDIGEMEHAPTTVAGKNSRSAQDNAGDEAPGNMDTSEPHLKISPELAKYGLSRSIEISLCGNLLHANMGIAAAAEAFEAHQIFEDEFKASGASIIKNKNLIIRCKEKYLPWEKAAAIILGMVAFGLEFPSDPLDAIPVEQDEISRLNSRGTSPLSSRWRFWSIPFRRVKTFEQRNSNSFNDEVSVPSEPPLESPSVRTAAPSNNKTDSPRKQLMRTNIPTSEQIASLNLKDGQNVITFSFCTRVLGKQQVDARIYLWKSNARIVISDVDGTITKSDVLGQFMPLVGRDWTQSGVARLFSAIKENGYQLLFLSARAIVQAYLTRNFLHNLKQDGKALPNGPIFTSPDGLSYSFIREVVRRKPHEFKIACLEEIRALFPSDYNPFYAGFGNRDTDELSYRKIGIPKGKIFIINPKGEVAIDSCVDSRSYCSLHTLVNDMFPPTSLIEQEDFNNWNYWKLPFTSIED